MKKKVLGLVMRINVVNNILIMLMDYLSCILFLVIHSFIFCAGNRWNGAAGSAAGIPPAGGDECKRCTSKSISR